MTDERRNEHVAAPAGVPEDPAPPDAPKGGWAKERPPEAEADATGDDTTGDDVTPTPEAEDRARPI